MAHPDGPRFSVLITTHNHRDYVLESIRSALAQTLPPLDVVVVDDGSTDGTEQVLAAAQLPPQCTVIRQANGGQLAGFRTAFAACAGDVICLLDSDDVWEPDYLEKLAQVYRERRYVDYVLSDIVLFGGRQGLHGQFAQARDCGRTGLVTCFHGYWETAPTSAMSMRRSYVARLLDAPEDLFHVWRICADTYLNIGACILGAWKYYLPTGSVRYRVHGSNHWFGNETAATRYRTWLDARSAREYFRQRMYWTPEHLNELKAEFATHPTPCREDLQRYLALNWKSPAPLFKRIERALALRRYFRRHGVQVTPPPRAMARRPD